MKDNLLELLDNATHADWSGGAPAVEPKFARDLVDEILRLRSLARYEPIVRGRMLKEVCLTLDTKGPFGTIDSLKAEVMKLKDAYASEVPQAWVDVIGERHHQVEKLGFSHQQDDGYVFDELARAARAYLMVSSPEEDPPSYWPWDRRFWKPRDRRQNLVRAIALLLAEIERMDRK